MENKLIFEQVFNSKKDIVKQEGFLEKIASDYPYFSAAHFFLLQQTDSLAPGYNQQFRITETHFNNPHWLNFQLQNSNDQIPAAEFIEVPKIEQEIPPENADNNDDEAVVQPEEIMIKQDLISSTANSSAEALLFEPMHLVDYFASQGIKLSEEAQTADKLGKQLKSFTEWLKTMKKVHTDVTKESTIPSEHADKIIQSFAEKSNTEEEILTESMAEVLTLQGKKNRAIEVYRKLSLLNPSKNAYFAAKIEYLKGI